MPNKRYLAGRRAEYLAKHELEAEGWEVIRAAGSHGFADLVAFRPSDQVRCIQVKSVKSAKAVDRLFHEFFEVHPCGRYWTEELWVRWGGGWHKGPVVDAS